MKRAIFNHVVAQMWDPGRLYACLWLMSRCYAQELPTKLHTSYMVLLLLSSGLLSIVSRWWLTIYQYTIMSLYPTFLLFLYQYSFYILDAIFPISSDSNISSTISLQSRTFSVKSVVLLLLLSHPWHLRIICSTVFSL